MLTPSGLKALKPKKDRPYKRFDSGGLYIEVRPKSKRKPNGAYWWRLKYRFEGKEKLLSLGTYPQTSLKSARQKRDKAREDLQAGIDPSAQRRAAKERIATERNKDAHTFRKIAAEWLENHSQSMKATTLRQLETRLEKYAYPHIGNLSIDAIRPSDVVEMLRRIEATGIHETARRVRGLCSRIFQYAVVTGRAEIDPAASAGAALAKRPKTTHFAAITSPKRIAELLRAIDGYQGQPSVMYALKLAPLVFVRPGELRSARWEDFDLDGKEWRIPAELMKMDREHVVPLSRQAIALINELDAITGSGELLFPSMRSERRPISNNTINAALRRMGFSSDEMTAHGFRTMASTRLNEMGVDPQLVELQLAHLDKDRVRAAYNRSERMPERRKMMQDWANYLDGLRVKP